MRECAERANFLLSSDRVVLFGLSTVIRRALHEGPLSGNEPNFAKVAICAIRSFEFGAANVCYSAIHDEG